MVRDLFERFIGDPALHAGANGRAGCDGADDAAPARRRIADYIAGMTDRYALDEHRAAV